MSNYPIRRFTIHIRDSVMANLLRPLPIAVVIPWFGAELKGGAEQQAWQIATRLAARGRAVEVLTTCCRSFFDDWSKNHLPAGETREAGLTIRRFRVDARDRSVFDVLNRELLERPPNSFLPGVSPVEHERAAIWTQQNINSSALESHLSRNKNAYQAFIFLPYLYGVTLRGLPLVADRAWLQPCLHDEAYAYLPDVVDIFYQARGLLFISAGEMQLAAQLYGPIIFGKGEVAGAGIELESLIADHRTDLPSALAQRRFILCLGRRDPGKGVDRLIATFGAFRQSHPSTDLHLVLAGPGDKCYTDAARGILDLGLVSEAEKAALLQSCLALCQPSTNESFSRVLFEAWACSKPVVAHRDCLATAVAVRTSEGGWIAGAEDEWVARIAHLDACDTGELAAIGVKGRDYAEEMADWERVMTRYEFLLGLGAETKPSPPPVRKTKAIHQLLPNLSYGDAISNQAIQIRDWLREAGYRSEIFVRHIDARVGDQCQRYESGAILPADGLIYHHSIGCEVTPAAVAHPGPKCLIYHNITPAEFFQPYRPEFARLLRHGREELWTLARSFPVSVGVSAYNAEELALHGFASPGVLPLVVDPGHWSTPPDEALMRQLQDGKHNLLFVGRYAPNKCQHHLVEAFAHYLVLDPEARLILAGNGDPQDPYVQYLQRKIDYCAVQEHVIMSGHVTNAQLHAYYRTAHLFWSMSEHEGFCVPLIEAMWFDVPALAFRSSAVPETLSESGIVFDCKSDLTVIAALAFKFTTDFSLREAICLKQRRRRLSYLPSNISPIFFRLINQLI
jgi:glycosyltransferase involved in cell wall biosynthesis